jgi:hypothetical protein
MSIKQLNIPTRSVFFAMRTNQPVKESFKRDVQFLFCVDSSSL